MASRIGHGKPEYEPEQVQQEGVGKHPSAVIAAEKLFEILQADPFAAGDAEGRLVIPEGDLDAVHGEIAEDNEESQAGQQQHPQLPVTAQGHATRRPAAPAGGRGKRRSHGNLLPVSSFGQGGYPVCFFCFSLPIIQNPSRKRKEAKFLRIPLDFQRLSGLLKACAEFLRLWKVGSDTMVQYFRWSKTEEGGGCMLPETSVSFTGGDEALQRVYDAAETNAA